MSTLQISPKGQDKANIVQKFRFEASKCKPGRKEIPLGTLSFSYIPTNALLVCSEEPFSTDPHYNFCCD